MACDHKAANLAVSRIIPAVLGGIIVYACWVFTKPLCIDYFINPPPDQTSQSPRRSLGAGLLVPFYILLILLLTAYLRVLLTIVWNPGYIPRGPQWQNQQADALDSVKAKGGSGRRRKRSRSNTVREKGTRSLGNLEAGLENIAENRAYPFDAPGLETFYLKDVFVCQPDGKPAWCSVCCQFKTDRAHHCREVGRCVRKMDHFCPWVGGVVSETSFKFFIQFLFYGLLFTIFNIIVMAIFLAELQRETGMLNVHWLLIIALSGLFGFFTFGMLGSSLQTAMLNSTTIESLDRRTKVWTLAMLISRPRDVSGPASESEWAPTFPIVSYPSKNVDASLLQQPSGSDTQHPPCREFAILHTRPGENPFDLGGPFANLKEVMGYTILEWFLPLKHSPCTDHSSQGGAYPFGPVLQRLKREAGLEKRGREREPRTRHERRSHQTEMGKRRLTKVSSALKNTDGRETGDTPAIQKQAKSYHSDRNRSNSINEPANHPNLLGTANPPSRGRRTSRRHSYS